MAARMETKKIFRTARARDKKNKPQAARGFIFFKRADLFIAAVIIIVASAMYLLNGNVENGDELRAAVYVDGAPYGSYRLSGEANELTVNANGGFNVISISEGGVAVTQSDCPSKDCVRAGLISSRGQTICCLPHRLIVRIEAGGEGGVDAVSK